MTVTCRKVRTEPGLSASFAFFFFDVEFSLKPLRFNYLKNISQSANFLISFRKSRKPFLRLGLLNSLKSHAFFYSLQVTFIKLAMYLFINDILFM